MEGGRHALPKEQASEPVPLPPRPLRMDDLRVVYEVEDGQAVAYYVRRSDGQRVALQPTFFLVAPGQVG